MRGRSVGKSFNRLLRDGRCGRSQEAVAVKACDPRRYGVIVEMIGHRVNEVRQKRRDVVAQSQSPREAGPDHVEKMVLCIPPG